ncbi:MAG: substrate-binding domain-containing protein [Victivallales bacterium]|jgi:DNA-binding LacI/PurR family transcriptional regulator|nr:substrate-binding domain-containing protein [Victivallales bacterium]MBT7303198.1 substrate-binding domain-containing protein [Victivallales bacterium]
MSDQELRRNAAQPMYVQLADLLREEIRHQRPGSRFAGDVELGERYGVSKPVVRGAMSILVEEGRLYRQRGKGTFVNDRDETIPLATRTDNIAVVAPLRGYTPHADVLNAVQPVAAASAFGVIVRPVPYYLYDRDACRTVLTDLLRQTRGVVWVSPHREDIVDALPIEPELARRVVFVNMTFQDASATSVVADYQLASFIACRRLIESGRERLGFIGGNSQRLYSSLRLRGYRDALQRYGMSPPPNWVVEGIEEGQQGAAAYNHVRNLLREDGPRPDAIHACTDSVAAGVLQALREEGLRVPEDIALIGFDDSPVAQEQTPRLTTMRLPYAELGKAAMDTLMQQLAGVREPGGRLFLPCPLVAGQSCGTY